MIPIPIGDKHIAILEGSAAKLVVCEQCGLEYVYTVERVAAGQATNVLFVDEAGAKARARQDAQQALAHELQYASDPVPCPRCGWYQARMVDQLRRSYLKGMAEWHFLEL